VPCRIRLVLVMLGIIARLECRSQAMTAAEIVIGAEDTQPVLQLGAMSNRHGLVAGATGTGKTVTLQTLAEGFSRMGVPVFAADVKGDLSGIAAPGKPNKETDRRLALIPREGYQRRGYPVAFWDVHGKSGHALRTTVSEVGPLLLANLLELNDTQSGVLYAAFRIADEQGLLLLDLKDLKALLAWMVEQRVELRQAYGNITAASVGAIQRGILVLEEQGADRLFGEPALALADLMQTDFSGNGVVSILDATQLVQTAPRVYAALLLWLLSELFEELPEAGDADRPKLVLFFDEAHLLFNGAPKALLEKIEQVVRLIRSKGVGVYFVTQSPLDVPESVLGQLGLKIEHALRAFTPKDRQVIRSVARGFRARPGMDVERIVTELETGEALVSALDPKGAPQPVARTLIAPPESRIGPLDANERADRLARSPFKGKYDQTVDRESAFEMLRSRAERASVEAAAEQSRAKAAREAEPARPKARAPRQRQSAGEAMLTSAARAIGSSLGRQLIRGILGSLSRSR
jgi:DNA helicase HerA-like ATPase